MRLKSYFAGSIETALNAARNELGPEAMLVTSRKAPPEGRHLGEYEVVFATDPVPAQPPAVARTASPRPLCGTGPQEGLAAEIAFLRTQVSALRSELAHSWSAGLGGVAPGQAYAEAYARLVAADLDPALAQRILRSVQEGLHAAEGEPDAFDLAAPRRRRTIPCLSPAELEGAVAAALRDAFSIDSTIAARSDGPAIVALVGPPGSGKTTTIAKLAVNFGLKMRRRTQLFSLDTYRVGAAAQLRSYAGIIGVGFETLPTSRALMQALEEYHSRSLILIDTPGWSLGELSDSAELAGFLSRRGDVATHLVISASMRTADMNRVAEAFAPFGFSRLLFTKLDETETFGPILSLSARSGLPLSFFSSGQRVPEDIEAASKQRLVNLVWPAARDPELSVA